MYMIIIPIAMPASTELFESLPSSFCIHLIIEQLPEILLKLLMLKR